MNSSLKKVISAGCIGIVLFALRFAEKLTGFDTATGLSVPSMARTLLIAAVVFALGYALVSSLRLGKGRPTFEAQFAVPEKAKLVLVLGSFLFIGGGVWLVADALVQHSGIATLVTGGLAVVTGGGLLILTGQMARAEAYSVAPLLPALFFSAFWVLSLYIPAGSDPVLARYWLPILAAAMSAYAFAQLAGFYRGESKTRAFHGTATFAVMLDIAAMAEMNGAVTVLFLASAMVLGVFLALERD